MSFCVRVSNLLKVKGDTLPNQKHLLQLANFAVCARSSSSPNQDQSQQTGSLNWSRKRFYKNSVISYLNQKVTFGKSYMTNSRPPTSSETIFCDTSSTSNETEAWEMLVEYENLSKVEQKIHDRHVEAIKVC